MRVIIITILALISLRANEARLTNKQNQHSENLAIPAKIKAPTQVNVGNNVKKYLFRMSRRGVRWGAIKTSN